jgi:uncharacterized protein
LFIKVSIFSSWGMEMESSKLLPELIEAARFGQVERVRQFLEAGVPADQTDRTGSTALMFAAKQGFEAIVEILLQAGADPNRAGGKFAITPLLLAASAGQTAILRQLLAAGANPNTTNEDGSTALMAATSANSPEAVQELLVAGANVNEIDRDRDTALNIAIIQNQPAIVRLLLAAGANTSAAPLLLVPPPGDVGLIEALISNGAQVDAQDAEGNSLLLRAAELGYYQAIEPLLQAGATVDLTNAEGWTPLLAAAAAGHSDIIRLLLRAGADPNRVTQEGDNALHLAAIEGHDAAIATLGTTEPNLPNQLGDTPLLLAALQGHRAAVEKLLPRINLKLHQQGEKSIAVAGLAKHYEVAELLLTAGVNPNVLVYQEQSLLMVAVKRDNAGLVRHLVEAKVDLDYQDKTGATALMWAANQRRVEIVKILLQAGADPQLKNQGGLTAADIAKLSGNRATLSCFGAVV